MTEREQQIELALQQAKRVRRESNVLVKMLAILRDELPTTLEGTRNAGKDDSRSLEEG